MLFPKIWVNNIFYSIYRTRSKSWHHVCTQICLINIIWTQLANMTNLGRTVRCVVGLLACQCHFVKNKIQGTATLVSMAPRALNVLVTVTGVTVSAIFFCGTKHLEQLSLACRGDNSLLNIHHITYRTHFLLIIVKLWSQPTSTTQTKL